MLAAIVTKPLAALILVLAAGPSPAADEPAFGKRVQEFDMARVNPMQDVKFDSGGVLGIRPARGLEGSAADLKAFKTGDFTVERSFFGIKNPWFGNKVFATEKADDSLKIFLDGQKDTFATKAADTRAAREAGRAAPSTDPSSAVDVRAADPRAGAQGSLDSLADPLKKNLTVEDVREILNKNR